MSGQPAVQIQFDDDGSRAIQRSIELDESEASLRDSEIDLFDFYEIERTVNVIRTGNYTKIALQFPDELLADAVWVYTTLEERLQDGQELYILGDTSYGSCCVDEVAAEHANSDFIVHYGRSCYSPPSRIPTLFVFGKANIDTESLLQSAKTTVLPTDRPMVLLYESQYHHQMESLAVRLKDLREKVLLGTVDVEVTPQIIEEGASSPVRKTSQAEDDSEDPKDAHRHTNDCQHLQEQAAQSRGITRFLGGLRVEFPGETDADDFDVLFIGREGTLLNSIVLSCHRSSCYSFCPQSGECRLESASVNKSLMKRYSFIERAKAAEVVGVLMGTLGVQKYMEVKSRILRKIERAGRKSYSFVVGKVNIAKLANFSEIDVFVVIACPLNSLLDSIELMVPVVTPFELEMALETGASWTGAYSTDFREMLDGGMLSSLVESKEEKKLRIGGAPGSTQAEGAEGDEEEETFVSLATGRIVNLSRTRSRTGVTGSGQGGRHTDASEAPTSALALRNENTEITTMRMPAAEKFAAREFKGLDVSLEKAPHAATKGSVGVARSYKALDDSAE